MVVMSRLSLFSFFLLLTGHVAAQSNDVDDSDKGKPFDPTMGIVAVIIILVSFFFVLLFVSAYMRRRQEQDVEPGNSLNVRRQTARGLDSSVIETFPTFRYSALKTLGVGEEAVECPVCLTEFKDDETLRLIPRCCHAFHTGCIDAWLPSHATCPLCRANLVPVPSESVSVEIPDVAGDPGKNSPETPMDDIRCECTVRFRGSS